MLPALARNQIHHEKTKHIDIKLYFIRLEVSKGIVESVKIHTNDKKVDMLTKFTPNSEFKLCLDLTGICRR